MSYITKFTGHFKIEPALTLPQLREYEAFTEKRHENFPGSYYCQWKASEYGDKLAADDDVSFYEYEAWLKHVIAKFFKPWGCVVNGEVTWDGEESGDMGKLIVKDNALTVKKAKIVYE